MKKERAVMKDIVARKHGGHQQKKEGPFKVNVLVEEACRRVREKHGSWKGFDWPQLKKKGA